MWQLPWITIQNLDCLDSRGIKRVGHTVSSFRTYEPPPSKLFVEFKINFLLPTLWSKLRGVLGHFTHPLNRPWTKCTDEVYPLFAELVGKL